MIDELQGLVLKTLLTVCVIVGVLMGVRHLTATISPERSSPKFLTDPALEVLTGAEPPELKGLASGITQFTKIEVAFQVARSAGYHCLEPSAPERSRLSELWGPHTFYCSRGDEGFKPGDSALLLHAWYPRGFVRGVQLKAVTQQSAMRPEMLDFAPVLVAAKGLEFKSTAPFVDFIVDRFNREYHTYCYGVSEIDGTRDWYCKETRKERERVGLPRWDGKPVNAGTYESAVRVLKDAGFECVPLGHGVGVPTPSPGTAEQDVYAMRCYVGTFSTAVLVAWLHIDARTTIPHALTLEVGDARQRVPLTGKPMFDAPYEASIMVQRPGGDVQAIGLAMDMSGSDVKRINFESLDGDSRNRLVDALLVQMGVVLATPNEPTRIPMLQKLDVAAHMLTRFGESAVWLAEMRSGIPSPDAETDADADEKAVQPAAAKTDLPTPVLAALALARCRIDDQAPACLARFIAVRSDLRGTLTSAADEVRRTIDDLPESFAARRRVALLDRQIASAR
jgi:hypothetical protein